MKTTKEGKAGEEMTEQALHDRIAKLEGEKAQMERQVQALQQANALAAEVISDAVRGMAVIAGKLAGCVGRG